MKLARLSDKCLSAMYKEYSANNKMSFEFDFFTNLFNAPEDDLNMALSELSKSDYVTVLWADGIAYTTHLQSGGISYIESNPKLLKAIQTVKSIKDILTW